MSPADVRTGRAKVSFFVVLVSAATSLGACHKKVSQQECEAMVDRFAELVVTERFPDAGAAVIAAEKTRERSEAQGDDAFKNCTSEVQAPEHQCAMKATSSAAVIKCLE